jgi:hypothetical protein
LKLLARKAFNSPAKYHARARSRKVNSRLVI